MTGETLYERLGGHDAIRAVVDDFYDRVFADPLLEPYFEGIDREQLYAHQVQFISSVAGGPVSYDGDDMQRAHSGMGITEEAFDRVATYLGEALRENGVSNDDAEEILGRVADLRPDVVGQ